MVNLFQRNSVTVRNVIFLLLIFVSLAGCQQRDTVQFKGYLYFTQGAYLMRFSLRDSSIKAVTHLGDKQIREISRFGPDRLLISETATVSQKRIARISWIDLGTGEAQALYSGVQARFVAGTIVYDDGSTVFSIKQENGTEAAVEVISHQRFQLAAMTEVSDGRLLLEVVEDGRPAIHAYHARSGTLETLSELTTVCSLKGAVWVDSLERLACRERNDADGGVGAYVFAALDGGSVSRPELPGEGDLLALTYIAGQDALVFRESWVNSFDGQLKAAIWAHDVQTGQNHVLSDSLNLGTSVVYSAR